MKLKYFLLVGLAWMMSMVSMAGDDYTSREFTFYHAWIKEPVPGLMMTGGYVTIKNNTYTNDRLIAAYSEIAKKVELHTMTMKNEVMNMRKVEGGWLIPMNHSLHLAPEGKHLMFIGLQKKLVVGDKVVITLEFEKAGKIKQAFKVANVSKILSDG